MNQRASDVKTDLSKLNERIGKSDAKLDALREKGEQIIDEFRKGMITEPQAQQKLITLPSNMPEFGSLAQHALVFMGEHPFKKLDKPTLDALKSASLEKQ